MPKRQFIRKIDTPELQGEDSWIKVRDLNYGYVKKLQKAMAEMSDEEKVAANDELIRKVVVDWNWVDDDDNPLPKPHEDETVVDQLTANEVLFISKQVQGNPDDRKK